MSKETVKIVKKELFTYMKREQQTRGKRLIKEIKSCMRDIYVKKRAISMPKETYIHVKREQQTREKRLIKETKRAPILSAQIILQYAKKDTCQCQKRPTHTSKETCVCVKRDLHKRPKENV